MLLNKTVTREVLFKKLPSIEVKWRLTKKIIFTNLVKKRQGKKRLQPVQRVSSTEARFCVPSYPWTEEYKKFPSLLREIMYHFKFLFILPLKVHFCLRIELQIIIK